MKRARPPTGPRAVSASKTRRALAALRRAKAEAEKGGGERALSAWEAAFAQSVEARLEAYGSAFRNPAKGALGEPLSRLQALKLRQIAKKAAGKGGGGLKRKSWRRGGKPKGRTGENC